MHLDAGEGEIEKPKNPEERNRQKKARFSEPVVYHCRCHESIERQVTSLSCKNKHNGDAIQTLRLKSCSPRERCQFFLAVH